MGMFEVLAKGLGKNVDEATVKTWFFEEGDSVTEGDDLVELAAEDSVVTIAAPATGVLAEVCIDEDETVQRDEVLCIIDDEEGNEDNLEENDEIKEG
jgi:2-oxoglutarate dehydrogenase E2 component (dihydrolipoamide succinyltransferase)